MFEQFLNPKQAMQEQVKAEDRQKAFAREQEAFGAATDAGSDQIDLAIQDKQSDLLKWQQDLDDELFSLVLTLKGFTRVDNTVKQVSEPMCNDHFIYNVVIPQCSQFMSRNLINSNFNEKQLLLNLKSTMNDIADAMSDNFDVYGIRFVNYDLVVRNIKNTIKPGAFRALNGWTKKTDGTIIRRVEAFHEGAQPKEKKKGFLGMFGG